MASAKMMKLSFYLRESVVFTPNEKTIIRDYALKHYGEIDSILESLSLERELYKKIKSEYQGKIKDIADNYDLDRNVIFDYLEEASKKIIKQRISMPVVFKTQSENVFSIDTN